MWAAKQVRLHGMGGDSSHVHGSSHDEAGPSTSRPAVAPEPEGPHQSDSENDRDPDGWSTESDSDFDDEKAQGIFDDWVVSLPALQRKTLAVLLMQSFRTRQQMNVMDAAQEAASIVH